jgi:hypothetical protein
MFQRRGESAPYSTLHLTGLCVGIFMFTRFARSEPFLLLCDVTDVQVVDSVQFAHNLQTENFCSFVYSVIHCVCTAVQGKVLYSLLVYTKYAILRVVLL